MHLSLLQMERFLLTSSAQIYPLFSRTRVKQLKSTTFTERPGIWSGARRGQWMTVNGAL